MSASQRNATMYEGNSHDFELPPRNTTFSRSQEPSVATVYTNNSRNIGLPSVPPIVNTSASLSSSSFAKKSAGNANTSASNASRKDLSSHQSNYLESFSDKDLSMEEFRRQQERLYDFGNVSGVSGIGKAPVSNSFRADTTEKSYL